MAKPETGTMFLASALLILSVSVLQGAQAVDYLFWDGPTCSGLVQSLCTSISNGTCCVSDNAYQSVQVRGDRCQWTTAFKDGDCAANITINTKNGSICFDSGGPTYTAASWQSRCINGTPIVEAPIPAANLTINGTSNATTNVTIPGARRRALLSEFISPNVLPDLDCTRHVEVDDNVIYYREDPTKFIWSLRVDKADKAAMMQQLAAVPKSDKAFWLFTHGATYNVEASASSFELVVA
ncbi:hypothetical protein MPTK1_3g08080 [Marchantia polymorpha subsp. ruderalis]|nr:hypothetical protein MARPO_0006s0283 [Marchantia polymorpha]BBN04840.1 hypothetical protein Mp_3g08080 [Marchantia polymorpha subsp. ruderalis]|eukprot:PTQ48292.1 hypothetical protein MARPO_0006s0283 [Marchantia polymorpha]